MTDGAKRKNQKASKATRNAGIIDPELLKEPSVEQWRELIRDNGLSPPQGVHLKEVVKRTIRELKEYYRLPRTQISYLKQKRAIAVLTRALGALDIRLKKQSDLKYLVPHSVGEFLGNTLTFTALSEAAGRDEFPQGPAGEIRGVTVRELDMKYIEEYFSQIRQGKGSNHSHLVLSWLIAQIHGRFKVYSLRLAGHKGGRPPDFGRNVLIERMIAEAPNIIGRAVPTSKEGPFVKLCSEVLAYCGFPNGGAGALIVNRLQKRQKSSSKSASGRRKPLSHEPKF